ncbi:MULTISPECIES: glycosyltransferase [Niallia]|uniref:glycosyltransferase n=1 Tax=Niallia TaxID=2837506 RepID=UPI0030F55ADC
MDNIFLVWTKYQARVESLIKDITHNLGDSKIIYRDNPPANSIKKIILYMIYFFKDLVFIIKNKPKSVFVQNPPSYSLFAPVLYKLIINKRVKVISDLHNAMTREPWLNRIGTKFLLSQCDLIIVHNEIVHQGIREKNLFNYINSNKIIVLEDKTPLITEVERKVTSSPDKRPIVFFPASFNKDEPISEVIDSAKLVPEFRIIMTGNYKKLYSNFNLSAKDLPENVEITGWIETKDYLDLVKNCDILLGLTIFDDIQMSVSNEGLGAEKVMVLSDMEALRLIYQDGAIYTENSANAIAMNLRIAFEKRKELQKKIKEVKLIKEERYIKQLNNVINSILEHSTSLN